MANAKSAAVIGVAFTPDGRRAVTAHDDHFARVWRLPEMSAALRLEAGRAHAGK